jgi:hypothetical protein
MRSIGLFRGLLYFLIASFFWGAANAYAAPKKKEWTFLTYISAFNNLDLYSKADLNEMEVVGSTDRVNVVVQYGSYATNDVKRMYIQKDNNINSVTSPVLANLGKVDMGDAQTLLDFIKWGVANYPAKHYFINVWGHGTGWHALPIEREDEFTFFNALPTGGPSAAMLDISTDITTKNTIDTKELGWVLRQAAQIMGQKVDIFGTDSCLMAMVEVASEIMDSVDVFMGSEEVAQGPGWPYDDLLVEWNKKSLFDRNKSNQELAKALTEVYMNAYSANGKYCRADISTCNGVTFSTLDLTKMPELIVSIRNLGNKITSLPDTYKSLIKKSLPKIQSYDFPDYVDLGDFTSNLILLPADAAVTVPAAAVQKALKNFVMINQASPKYKRSTGVSIWMPDLSMMRYFSEYKNLAFHRLTGWGDAVMAIVNAY